MRCKLLQYANWDLDKCTECPKACPQLSYTKDDTAYFLNDAFNKTSVYENFKFNRFEPELYAYCSKCKRNTKKERN